MHKSIGKGAALAAVAMIIAACVSGKPAGRLSYFHDSSKTVENYNKDINECTYIAFEEGRFVKVPIEHPKGPGGTDMVEMRGVYGTPFSLNPLTAIANNVIAGYEDSAAKHENLSKCMYLRGYDSYYVSAELDQKYSALSSKEKAVMGAEMATAEEPVGTLMPWPTNWRRK